MALVDIEVPKSLRAFFSEFQPIFKHAFLDKESIGDHMKTFANENGLLNRPAKTFGQKASYSRLRCSDGTSLTGYPLLESTR